MSRQKAVSDIILNVPFLIMKSNPFEPVKNVFEYHTGSCLLLCIF